MSIETIQNNLEGAIQRRAMLSQDMEKLKTSLAEKEGAIAAAILAGDKTQALENEISSLQTRIKGTETALETLGFQIQGYQGELQKEKRLEGLARAAEVRKEMDIVASGIYANLENVLEQIATLRAKNSDYWQVIKSAGDGPDNGRVSGLRDSSMMLESELRKLMYKVKSFQSA